MKNSIGAGTQPLICAPLVGKEQQALLAEIKQILHKKPDMIEWRADFFAALMNTQEVIRLARQIKSLAGEVPLVFTIRSHREGGQPIALTDAEAIALTAAICQQTDVEYVDCELSNEAAHFQQVCESAHQHGKKVIASYHNFDCTPSVAFLTEKLAQAEQCGADVAKVAVMPVTLDDVLVLLSATAAASQQCAIPIITMSMGKLGVITRLVGGIFGSAVSFAIGENSSAPGQATIEDVKTVREIVSRLMNG